MPVEEHKELRDLVSQTLQAKGVLQKVQAEIRASVFLALEEQDVFKDKNPFLNKPLKDYVSSPEGVLVISLVKEFLDFFNLEFTTMVFDPETHAGVDYSYEGRSKLSSSLNLNAISDAKVPLLGIMVKLLTSTFKKTPEPNSRSSASVKSDESVSEESEKFSNGLNGSPGELNQEESVGDQPQRLSESDKPGEISGPLNKLKVKKDSVGVGNNTSLTSLGNLPPLTKPSSTSPLAPTTRQSNIKDIKAILELESGSNDEEGTQEESEKSIKIEEKPADETGEGEGGGAEGGSEISEVEDEVSEVASALTDDNTVDVSISRETGKADYMEDL